MYFVPSQCNGERAKEEASQSFEKLIHVLEEKKSAALRAIEASKNLRLDKLRTQAEEYQGLLENNGLVGYAQEVLKETDQSCFVQTAKQLHVRYLNYLLVQMHVLLQDAWSNILLTPASKVLSAVPCIAEPCDWSRYSSEEITTLQCALNGFYPSATSSPAQ